MKIFPGKKLKILGKIRSSYGAIRKIRSYLTNIHLHILYYSMIYSHINYCLTSWFHGNKVIANKIQKVCNKFNNKVDRHIPSKNTTKTHKALATSTNIKFFTLDQCLIKIVLYLCIIPTKILSQRYFVTFSLLLRTKMW